MKGLFRKLMGSGVEDAAKGKVMIVEDDRVVAKIYMAALQKAGFEVEIALDGQRALERVEDYLPSLMVLDLQLPKISGIQVLRQLRAKSLFKSMPVVILTNAFLGQLTDQAIDAGANMILLKANSTPATVVEALERCLSGDLPIPERSHVALAGESVAIPFPEGKRVMESLKDVEFNQGIYVRKQFLEEAPRMLADMRALLDALPEGGETDDRQRVLIDLYGRARALTGRASTAGLRNLATFSSAFEALLSTVSDDPAEVTPSVVRTLTEGVDGFCMLFKATHPSENPPPVEVKILVVDDDILAARLMCLALGRAGWEPKVAEHPLRALEILEREHFDAILLDVLMPDLDGFEVCRRLRRMARHEATPVIFVTSMDDFENRTKGLECGGNDFIGKPFLPVELAVKVLNNILQRLASLRSE